MTEAQHAGGRKKLIRHESNKQIETNSINFPAFDFSIYFANGKREYLSSFSIVFCRITSESLYPGHFDCLYV